MHASAVNVSLTAGESAQSRTKLRSIRGPNCVEASVNVTIVIEKTSVTTVITAAAIAARICRAASGPPLITNEGRCREPS